MAFLASLFGNPEEKLLKSWKPLIGRINAFEPSLENLSPTELKAKTVEFKIRIGKGEKLDDLLPEAYAVVREAAKRALGQRHFDVQLLGGIALYQGGIAEMKTGEGKTLVATLPAYLVALSGKGVHVVTVNDYLSRRDAAWMGEIYNYLGLSVGVLNHAESFLYDPAHSEKDEERDELGSFHVVHEFLRPATKKEAYQADITYGTNNEFGFDYLRDNLLYNKTDLSQREHYYAIVDEVDSILIDEARTPLIISGQTGAAGGLYEQFAKIALTLNEGADFSVDEKLRTISLTDNGINKAVEAKEGVRIKEESRTYASVTFQNYFRMYQKLSGMTGTAVTSKEEFYKVYGLETFVIPTHQPVIRVDHGDLIFQTHAGKMKAVSRKVKELNQKGQPVLIGTVSIEHNELLSAYLKNEGIKHEILNAKNHEREGEIIAQAGKYGAVTIATNMAGRGVDIKLGGNPSTKDSYEEVKALGGLFVLGTERHDARRIDNQLRGRSGRQGDPGATQFFVSLEDSLMRIFAVDTIKKMMGRFNIPEDEPIENKLITNSLEKAQEKIEGFNFDARKHVLEFDDVLNFQRRIIYERRRRILVGGQSQIEEYLAEVVERLDPDMKSKMNEKLSKTVLDIPEILEVLRRVILQTVDLFWVDHLEMMEYLRGSVNLRAYGQREPLVEYKKDGLRFFKDMEVSIARQIAEFVIVLNMEAIASFKTFPVTVETKEVSDTSRLVISPKAEVGRNDPCPCGSGKKYKKTQWK